MVTELSPGMLIGRYRLKKPIAQGGMGSVWSAIDTRLTRFVAVKLLPRILVTDPSAELRFEREARAMSRLQHANVVSIYDVGSADPGTGEELPYLVMELIQGESLDKILADGHLNPRRAARILGQVGRALGAAHEAGIVHRDLKPSNVMVSDSDHVKVLDFGLARLVCQDGHTPEDTLTTPGMVLGSCPYMAPEQALGQEVSPASDIFSCGAVLYEALAGQRTFNGTTPMRVLQAVVRCEYQDLSDIVPTIPLQLVEIVNTCLDKDPGKRFTSGGDFANALFDLVDNGSLNDDTTEVFAAVTTNDETTSKRNILTPILLVAALLTTIGIGVALGMFFGSSTPSPTFPDPSQWSCRQLLDVDGALETPTWHPNGKRIAVLHRQGVTSEILVVRSGDGIQRRLFRSDEDEILSFPRYSPDGTSLVIGSQTGSDHRLVIISVPGGTAYTEIPNAARGIWLDDTRILYTRVQETTKGLSIYDIESEEEQSFDIPEPRGTWSYGMPRGDGSLALLDIFASKSSIVIFAPPNIEPWLDFHDGLRGFSWAPSEKTIIAAVNGDLVHISQAGAQRLLPGNSFQDPCFSPDGRSISLTQNFTRTGSRIPAHESAYETVNVGQLLLFEDIDRNRW